MAVRAYSGVRREVEREAGKPLAALPFARWLLDRENQRDQPGMSLMQASAGVRGRERRKGEDESRARECLGGSWPIDEPDDCALRERLPRNESNESLFGTGGIRQPRLLGPTGQAERGLGRAEEAGLWIREIWEAIEKQRCVSDVSQAQLIFVCFVGDDNQEKWQQSRRMQASLTVYTLGEVQHGRGSTPA